MAHLPYSRQHITEADIAAVTAVLRSDLLTQGPAVPAFEAMFATHHQVAHAVAVSNATSGLHLACLALGVGPGDRVWTSPNSFVASANCALYCGATVDFVDIDPATRNMSADALHDKLATAERAGTLPKVLIPVHFAGLPCDLRAMRALADRYHFKILEDASHATGATYLGAPVGSAWVDASVFSFHAVKIVTTGEGGMVTTPHAGVVKTLRALRSHGITRDPALMTRPAEGPWVYEQQDLGFNCRMTDLQAALGVSQFQRLGTMQARRLALADRYDRLLSGLPLYLPVRRADSRSAWHLYAVEVTAEHTTRLAVFNALRAADIGVNVHYIPIHTQPHHQRLGFKARDFPAAEAYYARAISLPLFPDMSHTEQDRVVAALQHALSRPAAHMPAPRPAPVRAAEHAPHATAA